MPKNQTRESIEAELSASENERLVLQFEEFVHDLHELEADLQRLEQERGLSVDRTKPLLERMAALGMSKQAIDRISGLLDALDKVRLGRMDEIPEDIRRKLAEGADAEISALMPPRLSIGRSAGVIPEYPTTSATKIAANRL